MKTRARTVVTLAGWSLLAALTSARAETITKVAVIEGQQAGTGSAGFGCGLITIDTEANRLAYRIVFGGLTGAETVAHIHGPAGPGAGGGVLHPLSAGSPKVGEWSYAEGQEADILAGRTYINIHSSVNPGGEIRGQIVDLVAALDGDQPNPVVATPARGVGLFNIDTCANELSYYIVYSGLTAAETVAHIHGFAMHTTNGGVLHPLPAGSPKIGSWTYDESQERGLLDGRAYVNIHTAANPSGEIRGQVTPMVVPIDGQQEVGPVATPGFGCGLLALDPTADELSYSVRVAGLTGPPTMAHIHGFAPAGSNAGVKHNVGAAFPAKGLWSYPAGDEAAIVDGLTYFNVHTMANPGGEIRGQLRFPAPRCTGDVNCDGTIDVDDLVEVILQWGTSDPNADVNDDGTVNVDDLVAVILGWGPCA